MAPESHGGKRMIWPFLPFKWVKLSVLLINLIFLIAPSWSESNFILFLFFYSIRVGPSRSDLIRPGLAVRVDPVQLLYLSYKNMLYINMTKEPESLHDIIIHLYLTVVFLFSCKNEWNHGESLIFRSWTTAQNEPCATAHVQTLP